VADDLTPEEEAAATIVANINAARDKLHRRAAAGLLTVLALFAAALDPLSLRLAVDPEATQAQRRAAITDELQRQAIAADVVNAWNASNQAAHVDAVSYAGAATGHLLTDGELPVDPADYPLTAPPVPRPRVDGEPAAPEDPAPIGADLPTSYVSDGWIDAQLGGIVADLEGPLLLDASDALLFDLVGDSPGALYYLDLLTSRDFVSTTGSILAELGVVQVDWTTMSDSHVCAVCTGYADRSPYTVSDVPDVPHGLCRCWIMPTRN
jgi:hypothetical protein